MGLLETLVPSRNRSKTTTTSAVPEFMASSDPKDTERQRRLLDNYYMLQRLFKDTTYYRGTGNADAFNAAALLAMAQYAQERWPEARSNLRFGFASDGSPWGVANTNKGQEGELLWDIQKKEKRPTYQFRIADEANGLDMLKAKSTSPTYTEALKQALSKKAGWMDSDEISPEERVKLTPRQVKAITKLLQAYHRQNDWLSARDRRRNLMLAGAVYETGDPQDTVWWLNVRDRKNPKWDLQDALGGHDYAYDADTKQVFVQ